MDSLTHALIGATVAQLGPRQRIGREATWVMAGAAMLPDLDTLAAPLLSLTGAEVDDLTRMTIHRGISHSLLMVPIIALPAALLWWLARRRGNAGLTGVGNSASRTARPFALLYGSVLLAILCHPLLDWCTSYGTQLFAPITNARFSFDAIPIIDILFTPLLIVTLLACFLVRKAFGGRGATATLAIGWTGFILAVGYIAAGRVMHDRVVRQAVTLAGPARVVSANAYPTLGSIFLWRGVVRTDSGWQVSRHNLLYGSSSRPNFAPQDDNAWVAKADELEQAATFRWFAQGQVRTSYARRNGLHVVELHDMRYGLQADSAESLWALRVVFAEGADTPPVVERVTRFRGVSFRRLLQRTWEDVRRR
jgi:inner membrane protein